MTPYEQAKEKLLKLEGMLLEKHPGLPTQLREIHKFLKDQPECVTIFKDEPSLSAALVAALEAQTGKQIAVKAVKSPSVKASIKKASAADLGF
jgi:hypothetical protein